MTIYLNSSLKAYSRNGQTWHSVDTPQIDWDATTVTFKPKNGDGDITITTASDTINIDGSTTGNPYTVINAVTAIKAVFPKATTTGGGGGSVDLTNYYTKPQANAAFQPAGSYLTASDVTPAIYQAKVQLWVEDYRANGDTDADVWDKALAAMDTQKMPLHVGNVHYSINRPLIFSGSYFHVIGVNNGTGGTSISNGTGIGFINSATTADTTYPTTSNPAVLSGCAFYFTANTYYLQMENIRFNNFRFAIAALTAQNSPTYKNLYFSGCNVGIIYYQGSQNVKLINCKASTTNTVYISSATCFPTGTPYANQDNYYTDGFNASNEGGYGSFSVIRNDNFDTWFVASILRPSVGSYSVNNSGYVYPYSDTSKYCTPSGYCFFMPMRNRRYLFGVTLYNLDVRVGAPRGLALLNDGVHGLDFSDFSMEGMFTDESDTTVTVLTVGSVVKGTISNILDNVPGSVDLGHAVISYTGKGNAGQNVVVLNAIDTASLSTAIATNTSAIATNTTNITSNTTAITALKSNIAVKRDYNAKGDAVMLTDAVITAGNTTVTSASASFSSADVGKTVCIPYAGTGATVGQSHITTIASVTDAHTIVLTAAPTLSIVGARTVTDAAINLNTINLNSATANFTQGDIGKKISIPGAGLTIGNSGGSPQACYIATIVSSTQVTLTRRAMATVSAQTVTIPGATLIYGTDDTTVLQSAITAGAAAKKPVILEAGKYLTTAALVPVSNTKVIGFGAGASVIYPCGTNFAAFQNAQTGVVSNALTDCHFSDFEVDGIGVTASTYTTGNKAFYIRPMIRPIFKNLYVHNTSATGIGCDWLVDYQITNCTAEHCGRQIAEFGSGAGGAGIGIGTGLWTEEPGTIQGNHCFDNGNYGIFVESQTSNIQSKGIRIIANDCRWNNIGIGDHATEGTEISGNTVEYNTTNGIDVSWGFVTSLFSKNGHINGNVIRNNFSIGIAINHKDGSFTITNNEITGGATGIQCTMTTGGTLLTMSIKNNIIHESTGSARGIYFPSGTWNVVELDNNTIFNVNNSTSTTRPAIHLTPTSITRLYVTGNKAWDTRAAGSKTQSYGLVLTGTITTLCI
jgi:hypothetical protein